MLKHLKIGCVVLLFCLPLLFWGISLNNTKIHNLSKGNFFFDKTRNHPNISSIVLSFNNNNKQITINKKDDLWHIKEADDYFVSFAKINTLVSLIRNTIIFRADIIKDDKIPFSKENTITISSYDNLGNIVEQAIIAQKTDKNKYHYALLNNDGFLYQVNGAFNISSNVLDWLQMPILKIKHDEYKTIKSNKFHVFKSYRGDDFKDVNSSKSASYIINLINNLWYLSAIDVKHSVNFNTDEYKKINTYEISLFNGIIYYISIYNKANEYWLTVRLNKGKLSSKEGVIQIEENEALYKGWYFRIPSDKGEIISNFVI